MFSAHTSRTTDAQQQRAHSRLECPRGHEFGDEDEDLSLPFLGASAHLGLPGVIETEDVGVLESLEDGHLLLEPCLLGLVVSVLLWRVRGEGGEGEGEGRGEKEGRGGGGGGEGEKEGRGGEVLVSNFSTGRQHISCL